MLNLTNLTFLNDTELSNVFTTEFFISEVATKLDRSIVYMVMAIIVTWFIYTYVTDTIYFILNNTHHYLRHKKGYDYFLKRVDGVCSNIQGMAILYIYFFLWYQGQITGWLLVVSYGMTAFIVAYFIKEVVMWIYWGGFKKVLKTVDSVRNFEVEEVDREKEEWE